jgi:hypothetical protein
MYIIVKIHILRKEKQWHSDGLRAGLVKKWSLFLAGEKDLFRIHKVQTDCGAHEASLVLSIEGISPRVKWQEHEADYSI